MLPPPGDFNQYEPDVRERMMRWNDATTVDESHRQDRLVDEQIRQARLCPTRSLVVVLAAMILAAVSVFGFNNTLGAAIFMAAPLFLFAQRLLGSVRSRSSSHEDQSD
jgi:hypothetical protein